MMISKTQKVLTALVEGKSLTAEQIATKFKSANPHDVIYRLRGAGHKITTTKNSKGNTVYSLTKSTKKTSKK